ncbi:MAG: 7-carboxy-7-deazaguanine synthase QueE [Thiotrichales bacterium]|nr:MAG: 7-carboxy-7-deazaguanine synthase QueE [Thiotrichales bacterium]
MVNDNRLKITEIFFSLQGEALTVGIPTTFVRLTGCPLRCQYCDTAYAFSGGTWMNIEEILDRVAANNSRYVTVTGGEPLAQKACLDLLVRLCDADYRVSLETSGALDVSDVDPRVVKVMDIKTPGSGEQQRNRLENLDAINAQDQIKFVICDEQDYRWSSRLVRQHQLDQRCEVLFSPSYEQLAARELADWILRDALPVRMQMQLHKLLWGNQPGK